MLCALVVIGGLARGGAALASPVGLGSELGLIMELVITPLLFIWRERVEAASKRQVAIEPAPTLFVGGPWG